MSHEPTEPQDPVVTHAADGIEDAVRKHTVGIVSGSGEYLWRGLGSGVLVRWKDQSLVLTAAHVLDHTRIEDVRFFLPRERPTTNVSRDELKNLDKIGMEHVRPAADLGATLLGRDKSLDLAALRFETFPAIPHSAILFDLRAAPSSPDVGQTTVGYGFPMDITRLTGPTSKIAFPSADWEAIESVKGEWDTFDPALHFLTGFGALADDEAAHPLGFSGSGRWRRIGPTPTVWHPNVELLGITLAWHRRHKQLMHLRLEPIVSWLERTAP